MGSSIGDTSLEAQVSTKCTNPLELDHDDLPVGKRVLVRCGQCLGCVIWRKQRWIGRLLLERQDHETSVFLTMTYQEAPQGLDYRDVQLFYKRLRKLGPFRHFTVGEYGSKTGRPHWHSIMFSPSPRAVLYWQSIRGTGELCKYWQHGYISVGDVNRQSIGYVCKYALKEALNPEFVVRCSLKPGIGARRLYAWGERMALQARELTGIPNTINIDGRSYPLCSKSKEWVEQGYLAKGGTLRPILPALELSALDAELARQRGDHSRENRISSVRELQARTGQRGYLGKAKIKAKSEL